MPWLYYADSTEAYLYDKGITTKFHPYDIMPLKLAKYSVEGDYEGLVDASSGEIQLCDDEIQNLDVAYTFGVNYYKKVINPLTAKLFNLNFHPLEVVSR